MCPAPVRNESRLPCRFKSRGLRTVWYYCCSSTLWSQTAFCETKYNIYNELQLVDFTPTAIAACSHLRELIYGLRLRRTAYGVRPTATVLPAVYQVGTYLVCKHFFGIPFLCPFAQAVGQPFGFHMVPTRIRVLFRRVLQTTWIFLGVVKNQKTSIYIRNPK